MGAMTEEPTPEVDEPNMDASLVERVRTGDRDAFHALYGRHAPALFRYLRHRVRGREAAEDLVQELFVRIWSRREKLDPSQSIKAYAFRIAGNLAIDHLRRKIADPIDGSAEVPEHASQPEDERLEQRRRLDMAMSKLSEEQRKVFQLSRFGGLTYAEIATSLSISVKMVEYHMTRALKKLRLNLADLVDN